MSERHARADNEARAEAASRAADAADAHAWWSWLGAPDRPLLFEHFRPKRPFWMVIEVGRRPIR